MASTKHQAIDVAAADWAARIDRGPLSPADAEALETWLVVDGRHRGAFMRMRAIALHTERAKALGVGFDPNAFLRAAADHAAATAAPRDSSTDLSMGRRHVLWVGAAAAACAAAGVGFALIGRATHYDTRLGEVRVVTLEDGSVMTINTASKVEVRFDDRLRSIRLIGGEALFDVAKNKARPFIVEAGAATVQAVGTSFTVRHLPDEPIVVLVREGVVEVRRPAAPAPVRLSENMRAEVAAGTVNTASLLVPPEDVDRELAWREGRIEFEGDSLDQAAAAFARYSETRIVFDDPSIGREEITGLFEANDPVSFAQAAALSLGLHSVVEPGQIRLSR